MKYLENLNPAQKEAVLTTTGPVSVLAGAGSGKTRVLTTRIYHLIRQGVPGNQILAVTFTNKAAREMRERVRGMLGEEDGAERSAASSGLPFVATFHGLGRELLESYGKAIGVPRFFSIFDRDDSERAIAAALKVLDIEAKELSPRSILSRISKAKGEGMTAAIFREKHGRSSFGNRVAADAWLSYERTLREEKALDFDDLISLPVRLLEQHADVRALAQERWRYIHIDEYQDTNELQGRLAALLSATHRNLLVVGDIDQTIYTWRGATIENLLAFEKKYPEARTIILEHNYRSTRTIVDAANAVIEKNKNRKEKRSVTDNPTGEPITIHVALNADAEALWIAHAIKSAMEKGTKPEEIAVLFRTNFQSRALEEGLLHSGVPYKLLGTRFFERKEVKDVLSWVRLALEPTREADKMRAAQFPSRGIGKTTLGKLVAGQRDTLRAGERTKVEAFEMLIAELSQATNDLTPSAFVRLVVEKSGIKAALAEGTEEERERFENIQELATLAARHDMTPGKEGIAAFVAEAALASDQDELDRGEKKGVTLMTVHAAKGLEFDTVFVAGMEEGLFPHEGMGGDSDRDEEEERRLFYVAMTRAKKKLCLTLVRIRKIYGTDYLQEPSSFLEDIDRTHIVYDEGNGEDIIIA
ncbi:MAG TPA: UvrD-helicase domain-containing protein [Candidatus Paceibacterota bacterium]|nr:UvrD-helicase domain-containing protein [Candidatus Paceibacterota bacterium]